MAAEISEYKKSTTIIPPLNGLAESDGLQQITNTYYLLITSATLDRFSGLEHYSFANYQRMRICLILTKSL